MTSSSHLYIFLDKFLLFQVQVEKVTSKLEHMGRMLNATGPLRAGYRATGAVARVSMSVTCSEN